MNIVEVKDFSFSYPDQRKEALEHASMEITGGNTECNLRKEWLRQKYTLKAAQKCAGSTWCIYREHFI